MKFKTFKFVVAMMVLPGSMMADVQPNALFTDGMVIQREMQVPVWGTADAGEKVTVEFAGQKKQAETGANGEWMVKLDSLAASSESRNLVITSQATNKPVTISNVVVGEVWFCSGQSNMEFTMGQFTEPCVIPRKRTAEEDVVAANYIKNEIQTAQDNLFRKFTVERNPSPLETVKALAGSWMESSPENNASFSATAYFFGRDLRTKLDVPVGLIISSWGGTRIEPWMPEEVFQKNEGDARYFERDVSSTREAISKWEQVKADYEAALKAWEAKKKKKKKDKPKMPKDPKTNILVPSTLFNGMVYPVMPYAIKGTIWYQGESNTGTRTPEYEQSFRGMITEWRRQWNQGDFPFYFAQIASFRAPITEPEDSYTWTWVRDLQRRTLGLKNTGMAVLSDIGEAVDVHPHNKIDVGKRLALWALKKDYNQDISVWSGPLYKSHEIQGNKVIVTFDHVGSGLMAAEKYALEDPKQIDGPLKHFHICGKDYQWKWANAEIIGKDSIAVSHPDIAEPVVVRYAWAQNPASANLYNKEGLPASVFTTETAAEIKIQQAKHKLKQKKLKQKK